MTFKIGLITSDLIDVEPLISLEPEEQIPQETQHQCVINAIPLRMVFPIIKTRKFELDRIRFKFAIAASSIRSLFQWNRGKKSRTQVKIHTDQIAQRTQHAKRHYLRWVANVVLNKQNILSS